MTKYSITTVAGGYDDGSNAKLNAALEALFNPPAAVAQPPSAPPEPAAGKVRLSSRDEPSSLRERLRKPLDPA